MTPPTLARPLAWAYVALVSYASLYPFTGWRAQDDRWLSFMWMPTAPAASRFDFFANLVGYVPLGFLLGVWVLHTGRRGVAWLVAVLLPSALSLALESLQVYLPSRVPSRLDWVLNTGGGMAGVLFALVAHKAGMLAQWRRIRGHWFVPDDHGALVLLVLWPCALLYPTALPFGLGQVWLGVNHWMAEAFAGTPWAGWWVVAPVAANPLSLAQTALGIAASLLVPCLLGYSVLRDVWRRWIHTALVLLVGVGMSGLSSALAHGPQHAWSWWSAPVVVGVGLAWLAGMALSGLTRRAALVWMLMALLVSLFLLNRMPEVPYLTESQDMWAQGRFIRFYGLTQWLGWLWPYLAWAYALRVAGQAHPVSGHTLPGH